MSQYQPPTTGPGGHGPYAPPPRTSPLAVVSLVLGIAGVCCGQLFVLSAAAVFTGLLGRRQIRDSRGALKGDGLALSGLILGVVGIVVGVVYWILVLSGVLDTEVRLQTS